MKPSQTPKGSNTMKRITIYTSESGTRSKNVDQWIAATHIAARGSYATESEVLLAFIESEGVPSSLTDSDGDAWNLTKQGFNGNEDFYIYELAFV
jgi:hypothetical protein